MYESNFDVFIFYIYILMQSPSFYNLWQEAAKMVQPSSRREGFSAIPNVKWDDVGGLHLLRQEFNRYIVRHIKFPEDYEVNYFIS